MTTPRVVPTSVLAGHKGDKGDQGEVGPSGGPFPDLDGVDAGQVAQTTGDGGVEFIDLSASIERIAVVPSGIARGAAFDPTGTNDSTSAFLDLFDDVPVGGQVYVPAGTYKISDHLIVNKPCSILGESSLGNWTSLTSGGAFDLPIAAPYLRGVVFNQTAAGKDGFKITSSGSTVHLENLGVIFTGASVRFVNTGHGFNATPTATVTNGHGTAPDHGLIGANWKNLNVFGHDGDHYGYEFINPLLCTLENLRAYGGGGIEALTDSVSGNYGNIKIIHPYSNLFCEGTAHGYHFDGNAAAGGYGLMNMVRQDRPQCNGEDLTAIFPTTTAPNPAVQYLILVGDTHAVDRYGHTGPDFESPIGMLCNLGESRGHFIDVSGTPELAGRPTLTKAAVLSTSTATLNGSATDNAGFISVTAVGPPGGTIATAYITILTVMWEHRDSGTFDDIVNLSPGNGNAPTAFAYPEMIDGGFELRVGINLAKGEQYKWNYTVGTGNVLNT